MKTFAVKIGFMMGESNKILYRKYYSILADSEEEARKFVSNGLAIIEFRNFRILEVKEIENEC